jgi:hypothetical protein
VVACLWLGDNIAIFSMEKRAHIFNYNTPLLGGIEHVLNTQNFSPSIFLYPQMEPQRFPKANPFLEIISNHLEDKYLTLENPIT